MLMLDGTERKSFNLIQCVSYITKKNEKFHFTINFSAD